MGAHRVKPRKEDTTWRPARSGLPILLPADGRSWSRVLASAEHIHRTALDLLDIAASQDGKLTPRPDAINLGALLAELRELLLPQAERRGQSIELCIDVPPGALRADPHLLRRVLQNLVDNALHHGAAQSTVRLEARAGVGWVEIAVCDESPSIPSHLRERVFPGEGKQAQPTLPPPAFSDGFPSPFSILSKRRRPAACQHDRAT